MRLPYDQRVGFAALDLNTGVVTEVLLENRIFSIYAATDALIFGTMLGTDGVSDVGIIETGSWEMLSQVSAGGSINDIAVGDGFALVTTFQVVTLISTADARSARVVDRIICPMADTRLQWSAITPTSAVSGMRQADIYMH